MDVFNINGTTIDFAALPEASQRAMASRGLTHYFGSELSSKAINAQAKHIKEQITAGATEATAIPLTEDEISAVKSNLFADMLAKLLAGEVGARAPGIVIDPLEVACNKIAKQEVIDILKANKIKVPKGDEAVKFADGTEKTLGDMVATRLEKNRESIEKAAKKVIAERQKAAKAAELAAAGADTKTADALGL